MVYVITPVHNRREITRNFLECLRRQSLRDFEVVIIDDGSTDGTSSMIAEEFDEVSLLTGDGALWWTGATNVGLRYALAKAADDDYVLIINDDVEIDDDYLDRMTSFAARHPRALVGSVIVDVKDPDRIVDGGRLRNWITAKLEILHRGLPLSSFSRDDFFEVAQLSGRGMLAPVRLFREIGLYDAERFKHRGDTELPVRAARHGYRLLMYYGAAVRSHTDLTNATEMGRYRLGDFRKYFFDFRSSGSVAFRYNFAVSTYRSPLQFTTFLLFDLARSTSHFFRNCDLR